MTRQHWSDEERAAVLAVLDANGGPTKLGAVTRTARDCGVSRGTLRRWIANPANAAPAHVRLDTRAQLREMWERVAGKAGACTEAVLDASQDAPDPRELRAYATTAAIATDKVLILGGEATERIEHVVDLDLTHAD